jgi:tRNA A37 threonylcarbamoyltransferase TsaD
MKNQNILLAFVTAAVLLTIATAQNPIDIISAPIQEKLSQAPQEVAQHIVEGNISAEHLQKDVNTTTEELKKTAAQEVQQHSNVTSQDLQKMAEQELKNQVNQRVQQPGFEIIFAAGGILAAAYLLRRKV